MKCPHCGADNRPEARFCLHCGAELVGEAEPPVATDEREPVAGEPPLEASPVTAEPEEAPAGEVEPEPEGEPEPAAAEVGATPPEETGPAPEGPALSAVEGEPGEEPEVEPITPWRETPPPLEPLALGTVLEGRYVVVEVLSVDDDGALYEVHDRKRCWQCGTGDNNPDDAFCYACGASLERRVARRVRETLSPQETDEAAEARFEENGRWYAVLAEPEPEARPAGIRLMVGQRSDPGRMRELDEDSLLAITLACTYESETRPVLGLFAVADGMGGHEGGEVASKLALQTLARHVMDTIFQPELSGEPCLEETITTRLREAAERANENVYLARQKRGTDMGTTLTVALIKNETVHLAHVGDCRAYRWGPAGLQQLTTDHSLVASLIASGMAQPEELYTHPQRSVIYRSIGDKPSVEVDTSVEPLAPGERLIVCCDGLWEMIRDEGIEEVLLTQPDPQAACDEMVRRANLAGGEDNVSVIVVQVEAV